MAEVSEESSEVMVEEESVVSESGAGDEGRSSIMEAMTSGVGVSGMSAAVRSRSSSSSEEEMADRLSDGGEEEEEEEDEEEDEDMRRNGCRA